MEVVRRTIYKKISFLTASQAAEFRAAAVYTSLGYPVIRKRFLILSELTEHCIRLCAAKVEDWPELDELQRRALCRVAATALRDIGRYVSPNIRTCGGFHALVWTDFSYYRTFKATLKAYEGKTPRIFKRDLEAFLHDNSYLQEAEIENQDPTEDVRVNERSDG